MKYVDNIIDYSEYFAEKLAESSRESAIDEKILSQKKFKKSVINGNTTMYGRELTIDEKIIFAHKKIQSLLKDKNSIRSTFREKVTRFKDDINEFDEFLKNQITKNQEYARKN